MATKIYESIFPSYSIYVKLNGKEVLVDFTGGRGLTKRGGSYRTDDAAMQKELEAHHMFNVRFNLSEEIKEELPGNDDDSLCGEGGGDDTTQNVEEVSSFQEAKAWLISNKSVDPSNLRNSTEVVSKAAELGVVFVNWPRK